MVKKPVQPAVSSEYNSFSKRLETNHKENKPKLTKPAAGGVLFRKLSTVKSQASQVTPSQVTKTPVKKSSSVISIDSDDENPKKDEGKRQAFMSHVKSLESQPSQQITPPAKGIKRFFPKSEEVKRPHVSSNGALCFDSPNHPIKRNLFGKWYVC